MKLSLSPRIRQYWQPLQVRFNALKPREQMLVTGAGAVILLALCDQLFWTPAARANAQMKNQIVELTTQHTNLQTEHAAVQARLAEDPNAELQRNIAAVRARVDKQNERLAALTVDLIPPEKMADVLQEVLSRRRQLQLVALQNEPAAFAFTPRDKAEANAESGDKEGKNALPVAVFRHGLTLQLRGRYFEIVNYLQALEQLPWHFYWEKLEYKVDKYPDADVTVKIYTLSNREGWIGA